MHTCVGLRTVVPPTGRSGQISCRILSVHVYDYDTSGVGAGSLPVHVHLPKGKYFPGSKLACMSHLHVY